MLKKRSYKQYPKEFKEEEVNLAFGARLYSAPEAANSMGIVANLLFPGES